MSRPTLVQRALAGHAAVGLLASALLYIIALSGSLVVIHDRWQRWEEPSIAETATLPPQAAQAAMAAVAASDAAKGKPITTHLYIRMPTDDLPRAVVTTDHGASYVDGDGRIVAPEAHAWTEFVIALHEYLNLPMTIGLIAVGALGVALASLLVTGVLAHPRILRDAFRLRVRHDSQIARADWHNRLGVWTLPWVMAVALTGAFIGLGSVGATVLAKAYAGGDVEKVYAKVFGDEPPANAAKAPLPDIARALATLAGRVPQARPTYVVVHDPATRGQHIQIIAEHPRRLIYGETYASDAQGNWTGKVGLSDGPIGKQFAASTYNLHFGNFAGLPVEIAYMALGLALCGAIATGTTLWLQKRRRRGLRSDRLSACWEVVVWGTPIALVLALWARAILGPQAPLAMLFWSALAIGVALGIVAPRLVERARLRQGALLAIAISAVAHLVFLRPPISDVVVLDVTALLVATAVLILTWKWPISGSGGSTRHDSTMR